MDDKQPRTPKRIRDVARYILEQLETEAWEIYAWHGSPFGESEGALDVWS